MNFEGPFWWIAIVFFGLVLAFALIYRRYAPREWQRWVLTDRGARATGAVGLIFAILGGVMLVGGPLSSAASRNRQIPVAPGAVALVVFWAVYSLSLVIIGRRAAAAVQRVEQDRRWKWVYWITIVAITAALFMATRALFAWLGYEVRH